MELLLDKGADVNAKASNGGTALMVASQNGHKVVVQSLLSKGAEVKAKTKDGRTASMIASQNGHKEIKELLAKGPTTTASQASGSVTTTGTTAVAEKYERLDDSRRLGLRIQVLASRILEKSDGSSDVQQGKVDYLFVGRKRLELQTNNIVHDKQGAWVVTKDFGRIRIAGAAGGGFSFWLTPSQKSQLLELYEANK